MPTPLHDLTDREHLLREKLLALLHGNASAPVTARIIGPSALVTIRDVCLSQDGEIVLGLDAPDGYEPPLSIHDMEYRAQEHGAGFCTDDAPAIGEFGAMDRLRAAYRREICRGEPLVAGGQGRGDIYPEDV